MLLNERRLLGCGVEIGVQLGEYSSTILTYWLGMHHIAPWFTFMVGCRPRATPPTCRTRSERVSMRAN